MPPKPLDDDRRKRLMRKMRRSLDLTVSASMGLTEAQVWWMGRTTVRFVSTERIAKGTQARCRLDLATEGRPIDIEIEVHQVHEREALRINGYMHEATYRLIVPSERDRLRRRIRQLNPDALPAGLKQAPTGDVRRDLSSIQSSRRSSRSSRSPSSASSRRSSVSDVGRGGDRRSRSRVNKAREAEYSTAPPSRPPARQRSDPRQRSDVSDAQGRRARMAGALQAEPEDESPRRSRDLGHRQTRSLGSSGRFGSDSESKRRELGRVSRQRRQSDRPTLRQGDPRVLSVPLPTAQSVSERVQLVGPMVRLPLPAVDLLGTGDKLMVELHLPDGQVLEHKGRVVWSRGERMMLELLEVGPPVRRQLQRARDGR